MNLSDMRAFVRRDLRDEDPADYRWTDDELDRHIARALREYSHALPLETKADIATTPGSREIDISALSDMVMVEAVEYPAGRYPAAYHRFALWADTLTLLSDAVPDGSEARVFYGRLHTLSAQTSTVPAQDEDLVAAGAAAYAMLEWAGYSVNRVNVGGAGTAGQYREQANERLAAFRRELRRLGPSNKVRGRQLYTPATTPVSRATDAGP